MTLDPERVAALIRDVADSEIVPRYRRLGAEDVAEKAPGDVVTVADRASEDRLGEGLQALRPGVPVVGEEAVFDNPHLLDDLAAEREAWLVDPLDGTNNFAEGKPVFAVMVSLLRYGIPVGGWIHDPLGGRTAIAEMGGGTRLDGSPVQLPLETGIPFERMQGGMMTIYLPDDLRADAEAVFPRFAGISGFRCAAFEYLALLQGDRQFSLFHRARPWDHGAGTVIIREASGISACYDGTPFQVCRDRPGLVLAPDADTWRRVRALLLPSITPVPGAPLVP